MSLTKLLYQTYEKVQETYLPADYPESVKKGYLSYAVYGNISATSLTTMTFLSTQVLFVALGGTTS